MNLNHKRYLILTLILFLIGCSQQTPANLGEAPDFNLPTAGGSQVSLADYTGNQPVLLYFHMAVG